MIVEYFVVIISLTTIFFVLYIFSKEKTLLKCTGKEFNISSVNLVGTGMYGRRLLNDVELIYYGLDEFIGVDMLSPGYPVFKTKFITLVFPIIPLASAVVFNYEDAIFSASFRAITTKLFKKQAFCILAVSCAILTIVSVFFVLMNVML